MTRMTISDMVLAEFETGTQTDDDRGANGIRSNGSTLDLSARYNFVEKYPGKLSGPRSSSSQRLLEKLLTTSFKACAQHQGHS